ncbi:MAG TPA: hypothetical protein VJ201_03420 [Candidatus Babeliales bacterium]|nr:hypothetical protein [Candidatus Babeliales bacterium]
MKASEARKIVNDLISEEEQKKLSEEKARLKIEKQRITNASKTAKKWFDKIIIPEVQKRSKNKEKSLIQRIDSPHNKGGAAEFKALQKILINNEYKVSTPAFYEDKWHDPDWGHYDRSYWYVTISW